MTDLERRALLGDSEAQRECTEERVLLPCPFCGGRAEKDYILGKIYFGSNDKPSDGYYTYCTGVECPTFGSYSRYYRTEREAILAWNTRPAPPIGRCGECKHSTNPAALTMIYGEPGTLTCHHGPCNRRNVNENDFCSYFEPKGGEENG